MHKGNLNYHKGHLKMYLDSYAKWFGYPTSRSKIKRPKR